MRIFFMKKYNYGENEPKILVLTNYELIFKVETK